jgi:hypothetical protein
MTYRNSFLYDGEEYSWEDELDCSELWALAELGTTELFEYAGAEEPEDFDHDLFEGPFSTLLDDE